MGWNGSGTFTSTTSGIPVVTNTVISSTVQNNWRTELDTGITTCIAKDGQSTTTARIPFASGISSSNGTAAAPSIIGINFTTTGIYWATGLLGFSIAGTGQWAINATELYPIANNSETLGTATLRVSTAYAMTLDVGLAGTATGSAVLRGTTSGVVTLSVADAAGTYTLKLPTGIGTADFALITDGTNQTSFVTGQSIAGLKTSSTPQFTGLEIGHATDTTLARVSAGILSVEGNPLMRFADARYEHVQASRDMTAASGNVAYTGSGFTPSAVFVIGCVGESSVVTIGYYDGSENWSISAPDGAGTTGEWTAGGTLIQLRSASGTGQSAVVLSLDSDGATLTWTKAGTPTGTADFGLLFIR